MIVSPLGWAEPTFVSTAEQDAPHRFAKSLGESTDHHRRIDAVLGFYF